jgi:hypothetical protein
LLVTLYVFQVYLLWNLIRSKNLISAVLNISLVTYFLQLVLSPVMNIMGVYDSGQYIQLASVSAYLGVALPMFVAMFVTFKYAQRKLGISIIIQSDLRNRKKAYLILFVFLFFEILGLFGFAESIRSFTNYLPFVASFYLIFSPMARGDKLLVVIIYIKILIEALSSSIFIEFLIWSTLMFFVLNQKYNFSVQFKILLTSLAFLFLFFLQSFKTEFRSVLWSKYNEKSGAELFMKIASNNVDLSKSSSFLDSDGFNNTFLRLNQGWHLEQAFSHVPSQQGFDNGKELLSDIYASFIPRLIDNTKKVVGGKDKFYKYTGYRLRGSTAMSIGLFGDAYVNFGSLAFLFILIVAIGIVRLIRANLRNESFLRSSDILWLPFYLHYFIRPGNDFYMMLNSAVKGFVIFLIIKFVYRKLFGKW